MQLCEHAQGLIGQVLIEGSRMIKDLQDVTRASADERVIRLPRASETAQRSPAFEVPSVFGVAVPFVLRVPRIGAQRSATSLKRLAGCNH